MADLGLITTVQCSWHASKWRWQILHRSKSWFPQLAGSRCEQINVLCFTLRFNYENFPPGKQGGKNLIVFTKLVQWLPGNIGLIPLAVASFGLWSTTAPFPQNCRRYGWLKNPAECQYCFSCFDWQTDFVSIHLSCLWNTARKLHCFRRKAVRGYCFHLLAGVVISGRIQTPARFCQNIIRECGCNPLRCW